MKFKHLLFGFLAAGMVLVGCDPKQNEGTPRVDIQGVDNGVLTFDKGDGTKTITMRANRDWSVSFDPATANEWINMQTEGKATDEDGITLPISVAANTGFSREATVTFRARTAKKTITIRQEGEGGSEDDATVYFNNFDKEAAAQTFGSNGNSWPYLDQSECWKNEKGTGAANVAYAFSGMSARNNSNSNGSYSDYKSASGVNNLLFGKENYFAVKNIALKAATNYTLSFVGVRNEYGKEDNVFSAEEFKVYVSDQAELGAERWVELTYSFANGTPNGRWDLAASTFTVPAETKSLSIYISTSLASSYRLDDLKLMESAAAGTTLDFTKGVKVGESTGGDVDPGDVQQITCAQFIENADENTVYRLKGIVTTTVNTTYCSFDMNDGTGTVVVWTVNNKDEWKDIVKQNGTVTVRGKYLRYQKDASSPVKHEMIDAYIEAFEPAEGGGDVEPGDVQQITCAQFIENADENTVYRLKGEVTTTVNTTYCSFDMNDGTGTVVVWTVNNKDEWKNVVKQGGTVTVRGKYLRYQKDDASPVKHEMIDAYIEAFEPAEGGGENPGPGESSGTYESNVTWTKGTNCYDNTNEGNSAVYGTVNGEDVVKWLKIGKSGAGGDATIKVPSGTKVLSFYAVAWNKKSTALTVEMNGEQIFNQNLVSNTTAAGNAPFTLVVAESDKYSITFESALAADTDLKFATTTERAILVGVKAE